MNNLQNLHTHSTYCDGKDTPEEMILTAIEKGFDSIGFSGHSYMSFSKNLSMSLEGTEEYKKEIQSLKEKYKDRIDVFLGIESELLSGVDLSGYDYIIGSVHYFKVNGEHIGFDRDADTVNNIINTYFNGNGMKYAKAYYELLADMSSYVSADIIGHFDLISKHCENINFFDINSPQYLKYAFEAIDALRGKIPFFEINTGAIARGYRTTPYPSIPIIKRLLECGFLPIITSDCHNKNDLDCHFTECVDMLETCGIKERYILTKTGFKAVPIR